MAEPKLNGSLSTRKLDNPHMAPEKDLEAGGITPRFESEITIRNTPELSLGVAPHLTPGMNIYQQKKNLAQSMLDLALLSANTSQLRYVLEMGIAYHTYFLLSVVLISTSLILQVAVGIGLIVNSTYNMREQFRMADKLNNFTVLGIFFITVINVFIASFGVSQLPESGGSGENS